MLPKNSFFDILKIMSAITNFGTLLRSYANKQNSAFVNLRDFCDYIKKYAEHYIKENPGLVVYLGNTEDTVIAELQKLESKHLVSLLERDGDKQIIIVIMYYTIRFAQRYKELAFNPAVPFPTLTDLPKQLSSDVLEKKSASDLLTSFFAKQNLKSSKLYIVQLPRNVPSILFPECVPIQMLIDAALSKIRTMLKKEEYHDYFLKKLRNANPGKEISIKTFFEQFVTKQDSASQLLESSANSFYSWSQLCYFIRQDFEKVKDTTLEDANLLQAVSIAELHLLMLKNKVQEQQQKDEALELLEAALDKPPYFYPMSAIVKMTDPKGMPLGNRYTDDDLKKFLERLTTESKDGELPRLLVFKIDSGTRYFVYKSKVFPLIIRLCNEAHSVIKQNLTNKWHKALENFEKLPEMHDRQRFESVLKTQVEKTSPVLYALLNANFLTLLDIELQNSVSGGNFRLFSNGRLLPYAELLMIGNATVLANAKILLPFWYSIPVVSQIIGFFMRGSKKKKREAAVEEVKSTNSTNKNIRPATKREAIIQAAKTVENDLVPEGSTVDRELDSYCKQWNKLISPDAHRQLTEDVNSLIRGYMRRVIHTISAQTFTIERVRSLAEALIKTPNMQKITEQESLFMYVQLYILRLISNG